MKINQHGGTIVEVLIAALIFAVALFALVEFQTSLLQERGLLDQESEALSLAQDKMQSFRNYTTLDHVPPNPPLPAVAYSDIANGSSTTTGLNATYTMTWTVTPVTAPTRNNVSITVTWTDSKNASQSITINSIIASIDPKATGQVSQNLP